jgi:Tfp pilus assembly major pilin PilA
MENTFQYIIVVIAVIAAIISKIRQQEKADSKTKSDNPASTPQKIEKKKPLSENWEKWLEVFEEEVKPVKQEPVAVNIHTQNIHENVANNTKLTEEISNKKEKEVKSTDEQLEYRPEIQLNSIEEVRRAIIYSEIIHRKY